MSKNFAIGLGANILLFGTAVLVTEKFTILLFMLLIYLAPMILNSALYNAQEVRRKPWLLPLITTAMYCGFSYLFIQQSNFAQFIAENSREVGSVLIRVQGNLLSAGQILFVFLINFGAVFLSSKLARRKLHAAG